MYDFRYNEAVQRGTPDFPIEYYLCDTSNPHFDLPVHWHVEYEIIHVLRGEYPFVLDGKECTLKPETICFIRDGSLHGEGVLKDSSLVRPSCLFESVVFNMDFIRSRGFQQDAFLHNVVHHEVAIKPFVTEKDAVKLADCAADNVWVLPVCAIIEPDLAQWLLGRLPSLKKK